MTDPTAAACTGPTAGAAPHGVLGHRPTDLAGRGPAAPPAIALLAEPPRPSTASPRATR